MIVLSSHSLTVAFIRPNYRTEKFMTRLNIILVSIISYALAVTASFGQKIALVVGNNHYQYANRLNSPVADATDVGRIMDGGGFTTIKLMDAGVTQMNQGLQLFGNKGKNADVCLFYFSGHGMEVNGVSYLIPVDGLLNAQTNLRRDMVPLSSILDVLRRTEAKRKIVILDCCRSNPYSTVAGGLASIATNQFPPATLIVYAGAPEKTVPDGIGRNSPFTEELIRQLRPGRDILSLFASVAAARFQTQDPWIKFDGSGSSLADLRTYDLLAGGPARPALRRLEKPSLKITSYWDHNGSTMGLLVRGDERIMIYVKVRNGLEGLVQPGMVLFAGKSIGARYTGNARRFTSGLRPLEYHVEGPILGDGNRIILTGKAAVRNPDGSTLRMIDDRLEFSYLKLPQ